MWFKNLVGFDEISPENVRENISIEGTSLVSKVNGKSYQYGALEIPTLTKLKKQASSNKIFNDKIKVQEVIGNVQELHLDKSNKNALFQAASQFNLLEMIGPQITPERGIDIYESDSTHGPACAIACGAGTIYRNYFVPLNKLQGQSINNQIDCLELIGKKLKNDKLDLWEMSNGYALLNHDGLLNINSQLSKLNYNEREELKGNLKIGIQWNTEVTLSGSKHMVSQAYCSALPIAYSNIESFYWEGFARIILEATYEATLNVALINLDKTGCNKVYLTLVGGGAFGNEQDWILKSLSKAIKKFKNTPLNVGIVSFGNSKREVRELINKI
ncbi:polysaccharide deacetylase family protein [Lutibacter citreus]|uniref:hypothetical protein n=1 Tax=Lutibacter citreus TaxID=2138210 RepID=UPI000DBE2B17|nr:hypothetical protein [Lutibacter citreus]